MASSFSPNKTQSFKSKSKQTNFTLQVSEKSLPTFRAYLKEFPIDISEDVVEIVRLIEPLQNDFGENLKALKLYKQQLAGLFEENWVDFLAYLKNIIIRMNKRSEKIVGAKEKKITELLDTIKVIEMEKMQLSQKVDKVHNLRELENAQLVTANNELEIVNKEMRTIYNILQTDMSRVLEHLTTLQEKKERENETTSNEIYSSLGNLSVLLDSVEKEHTDTASTLSSMKQMIKAMTKSTKVDSGTQVDESELQTKAGEIFSSGDNKMPLEVAEGISVNVGDAVEHEGLVEKMKMKQSEIPHQSYVAKKNIEKPWALTPTLLVFLSNMSKENEIGRVLPWDYMKEIIEDIYTERIKHESELSTSMVGNCMRFDEFVVIYFLKKHRIRRLAEVKLLELIISLKYYTKFWPKAEIFCFLLDVMRYQPLSDPNQSSAYKLDFYAQNFFFSVYKQIQRFEAYHDDDGTVYLETKDIRKLMKVALFFTDEVSKSRISVRIEKNLRIFKEVEYCDMDFSILLILDEFASVRKRNINSLTRAFSKSYDKVQGFFNLDQVTEVFDCMKSIYRRNAGGSPLKYPVQSELYLNRLYLNAITSGKNNYEILANNFLTSVQKYGFDSPYPFILESKAKKSKMSTEQQPQVPVSDVEERNPQPNTLSKVGRSLNNQQSKHAEPNSHDGNPIALNTTRIDIGSKLFSQHFTIMKQMNDYLKAFSETLAKEKNPEVLWKSFNQIKVIMERGCEFMKFPLVKEKIV